MPTAVCDGIQTRYEVRGHGPPLLLFSPGGFNGQLENWWRFGIYERLQLIDHLEREFTCIAFDKRESGESGGRIEQIAWADYARQGIALLDELGIERAHFMGGCIGCSIVVNCEPARMLSMVLYSPAGGAAYLATQRGRFAEHLAFADEVGLAGVVEHVRTSDRNFAQDPRVGPWVSVIRGDDAFAREYAAFDVTLYRDVVHGMARTLFDRDTVPGAPPELLAGLDVPALVAPGNDANHATSAARYLAEVLPRAEYWDVLPEGQTAENARQRILAFLTGPATAG
jgi:pimeloyl-ACP methyl ester carboxylesterase